MAVLFLLYYILLILASAPSIVHANEFLNNIFLIATFGIGGIINQCIARPKCDAGLQALNIDNGSGSGNDNNNNSNNYCGCIANVEDGPLGCVKGEASCSSSAIFCIQDNLLCGDARMSMTFVDDKNNGNLLDTTALLYSYFLTDGTSDTGVYEIQLIATPTQQQDDATNTFESCTVSIGNNNDSGNCQRCNICQDGISFQFDCSDQTIGTSNSSGPVVNECLDFTFRPTTTTPAAER